MHAPEPAIARQPTQATAQLITPAADHVRPEITVRSGRIALHVRRVDMPDIEQAGGCNAASTVMAPATSPSCPGGTEQRFGGDYYRSGP